MIDLIVLYVILGLPLLLGVLFRVNASHIFFSLMAGELLGRYFGHDVDVRAQPVIEDVRFHGLGEVALILLPMIVTAFFLRASISKGKLVLHIPMLVITGIICAAFVLPVLPDSLQNGISETLIGGWILELNRIIIGVMVSLQLVGLWLFSKKEKTKKHSSS
jgi:hypothetical protein